MTTDNKEQNRLKKLMWLDFIFGIVGLIVVFCFLTPSEVINRITSNSGESIYIHDMKYYLPLLFRPFLEIYSIHRIYSGFKNLIILKSDK